MITTDMILNDIKVIDVKGYELKKVKIGVLDCYYNYKITFENIYKSLLLYTVEKGFLTNPNSISLRITNVYTETLNILSNLVIEQKKNYNHIINVDDFIELLADEHYKLNEKLIDSTFYKIVDNSIDDILIKAK